MRHIVPASPVPTPLRSAAASRRWLPVLTAWVGALVGGCAAPTSDAPVVLWEGYRYDWEDLSHRVAYLRSAVGTPDPEGAFEGELGIIGGNFSTGGFGSDVPIWTMSWLDVRSERLQVARTSLPFAIGPDGRAELAAEVDLASLGMEAWPEVKVSLAGVTFDTDVPPEPGGDPDYDVSHGWTPQRMGAGVGGARRAGSTVAFDAWMEFKAGPLDRPPMNATVPYANVAGTLDVSVIGVRADAGSVAGTLQTEEYILRDPPYTDIPPLPAEDRTLSLAGEPGPELGLPLLSSWQMTLNTSIGEEGRYLRAFGVRLEDLDYTPSSGEATLLWDVYCSHSSLVEEGDLEVAFTVEAELLQVEDPDGSVALRTASAASDVGPLIVQLP
jgi:hypothetical protein